MSEQKAKEVQLVKIHTDLFSTNDELVENALKDIVHAGDENSIEPLLTFYVNTENSRFKAIAEKVLYSLKPKGSGARLINALANENLSQHRAFILSIFWNAGIPANEFVIEMVEEALHGDFSEAFEVLTILDHMDGDITPEILGESIALIESNMDLHAGDHKSEILEDILKILLKFQDRVLG